MQTILTDSPEEAAAILNSGGVVAFPTETVYGLGAGICHPEAILQLFRAKGRPSDNPLIVHLGSIDQLDEVAEALHADARALIEHFFPGPLTLVLQKKSSVPDSVTAGLETVGVRCPSNPVAQEFLRLCGCPVAAPSANRSGLPSATSWEAVMEDLEGKIDCVLRGKPSTIGLESTIVECSGGEAAAAQGRSNHTGTTAGGSARDNGQCGHEQAGGEPEMPRPEVSPLCAEGLDYPLQWREEPCCRVPFISLYRPLGAAGRGCALQGMRHS